MLNRKQRKKIARIKRIRKFYNIKRNNLKRNPNGKATTSEEVSAKREIQEQEQGEQLQTTDQENSG